MAKDGKSLSADEAKEKLKSAKEKLMVAKDAMAAFCKENKLKKSEDYSQHDDSKVAKKWSKLNEDIKEKTARVEKYTNLAKEAKKSGGGEKKAKYNYPKEVTSGADKKKFRTDTRSKAKKAGVSVDEYLADPAKYAALIEKKSEKKASKEDKPKKKKKAPEAEAAPEKKKKKKAPVAEKETADVGED